MSLNFDLFCATVPFMDDQTLAECVALSKSATKIVSRHLAQRRLLLVCVLNLKNTKRLLPNLRNQANTETSPLRIVVAVASQNPMCRERMACELGSLSTKLHESRCSVVDMIETDYLKHMIATFNLQKKPGVYYGFVMPSLCQRITSQYHSGRMFEGFTHLVDEQWKKRVGSHQVNKRKMMLSFPLL